MSQINLPNVNVTGDNLWSQVEANDNAIKTVVNGDLDNGNIAANADINGAKLLDGSVGTAKIANNAVTAAKLPAGGIGPEAIAALAVLSGKIKFEFKFAKGAISSSGVGTVASIAAVYPGTYLALGQIGTNGSAHSPTLVVESGSATITQQASDIANLSQIYGGSNLATANGNFRGYGLQVGMIVVKSGEADIGLTANRSSAGGEVSGELWLFGVRAS